MDLRQKVLFFCEMIEVLNLVNGSVSGHCQVTCTVFYNDTPTLSDQKKNLSFFSPLSAYSLQSNTSSSIEQFRPSKQDPIVWLSLKLERQDTE